MIGKRRLAALCLALFLPLCSIPTLAQEVEEEEGLPAAVSLDALPAKSAILVEQSTGKVLFEKDADVQMAPASVTKVMSLLLVMEALDAGQIHLDDMVTCSEHASSMGGTQIWLEVGEQMSVEDLLKATCVVSANDATVALGEYLAGSEEGFVQRMNQRAQELGMTNTHFVNATGLDAEGHLTTARDISIMSRELMKHKDITKYTTIWMGSLRGGKNELVNTNKLVRFYEGATGLKTGTTDSAGSCLSATATRDSLSLVAVVMGCATSNDRFASARALLDTGFANYTSVTLPSIEDQLTPVPVAGGLDNWVQPTYTLPETLVVEKEAAKNLQQTVTLSTGVTAPVEQGQTLGEVTVTLGEEVIYTYPIVAAQAVEKMDFFSALKGLIHSVVCMEQKTG